MQGGMGYDAAGQESLSFFRFQQAVPHRGLSPEAHLRGKDRPDSPGRGIHLPQQGRSMRLRRVHFLRRRIRLPLRTGRNRGAIRPRAAGCGCQMAGGRIHPLSAGEHQHLRRRRCFAKSVPPMRRPARRGDAGHRHPGGLFIGRSDRRALGGISGNSLAD